MYGSPLFCLASEREEVLKSVRVRWFFPLSCYRCACSGRRQRQRSGEVWAALLPERLSGPAAQWPLQALAKQHGHGAAGGDGSRG